MIVGKAVSKHYIAKDGRRVDILAESDFEIPTGSFIGLVGRSGSGKTTALNLIGGLDRPSEGTILMDGEDLSTLSDTSLSRFRNEVIGFVFQHYFLRLRRTALENVMVPLMFTQMSMSTVRTRCREALDEVGIGAFADVPVSNLSGGQRQRVAIARAIVTRPRLLLADEPTGNLDVETGTGVFQLLQQYNREHGTTVVLVTHDPLVERFDLPLWAVRGRKLIALPKGTTLAAIDTDFQGTGAAA